jgi:hypothetical protein
MRALVRTSVLRLLKPYTAYQRSVDERVVEAVGELDARVQSLERIEPLVDEILDALEAIRARVQRLEPGSADSPFEFRDDPVAGRVLGYTGSAASNEEEAPGEPYLELLRDREPVLDLGAIEVADGDVNHHLAGLPDGELGAVFAARTIEQLRYADLTLFLRRAREKLQPGGLFIAETTQHALYPQVALTLCRAAGYESAYVFHPGGSGDAERDRYTCTDYAVVATK